MSKILGRDEAIDAASTELYRFKRLKEYKPGESWLLLLYGRSKAGKTYFAGTAGARTLFINLGDGIETLRSPAFTNRYGNVADEMIVVDIRDDKPGSPAQAFELVLTAINKALDKLSDQFDTIVLDEATAFRKLAINKAMELNTLARTRGARGSRLETFVIPEIGDYNVEMQMIEWFLGTAVPIFKEVKKNFLMLAHERKVFGKPANIGGEAPVLQTLPGFTGKTFPDRVPAYFDDVWRIESVGAGRNIVYRILTAGVERVVGGSRHGGIFDSVEIDPNYLNMLERIRNSYRSK